MPGEKKKAQISLGSLHSETLSWNTGEGQAMVRHLYSTWPERDRSVPRVKSSHAALKTESDSSLHKNFQGFGTCISYMLSKSRSSALEAWKQTEEKSSKLFLLQYYTLILLFLFIHYRVTKFCWVQVNKCNSITLSIPFVNIPCSEHNHCTYYCFFPLPLSKTPS